MEKLPLIIPVVFALFTLFAIVAFYFAAGRNKNVLYVIGGWLIMQSMIALTGFYTVTNTVFPRFILMVSPPLAVIAVLFLTKSGKRFIDTIDIRFLTLFQVVRIPVEISLYILFLYKLVPGIMTFEGGNYDIISGITAIAIYLLLILKPRINYNILLVWNIVCLFLAFKIVITAALSAPTNFQQFAFDQPNVGVLYFPFNWLPCCIVPLVFFSHFVSIRQLLNLRRQTIKPVLA